MTSVEPEKAENRLWSEMVDDDDETLPTLNALKAREETPRPDGAHGNVVREKSRDKNTNEQRNTERS